MDIEIEPKLKIELASEAKKKKMTVTKWINEAIKEKLNRKMDVKKGKLPKKVKTDGMDKVWNSAKLKFEKNMWQ